MLLSTVRRISTTRTLYFQLSIKIFIKLVLKVVIFYKIQGLDNEKLIIP